MNSTIIEAPIYRNTAHVCKLPGCGRSRYRLSAWCLPHLQQALKKGHPSAATYRPTTWANERKEVETLLASQPDHPGLVQVLRFVQDWMDQAAQDSNAFKGAQEVHRLVQHGVSARQLVTEVCAFWCWEQAHPKAFPDDRSRDFGCSRAVFAMAPRLRRPTGSRGNSGTWGMPSKGPKSYAPRALPSALGHVGKFLRQSLAPFIANVQLGVNHQKATRKDPGALQRLPFVVPFR